MNDDDKEILKLAAKAANISYQGSGVVQVHAEGVWIGSYGDDSNRYWNPLTRDAEALRLAVALGLELSLWGTDVFATQASKACAQVPAGNDRYAAVRRAIVRAAAQIGGAK